MSELASLEKSLMDLLSKLDSTTCPIILGGGYVLFKLGGPGFHSFCFSFETFGVIAVRKNMTVITTKVSKEGEAKYLAGAAISRGVTQ